MKPEDVLNHCRETLPDFDLLSAAINAEFRARFGDADPAEVIGKSCFVSGQTYHEYRNQERREAVEMLRALKESAQYAGKNKTSLKNIDKESFLFVIDKAIEMIEDTISGKGFDL